MLQDRINRRLNTFFFRVENAAVVLWKQELHSIADHAFRFQARHFPDPFTHLKSSRLDDLN